MPPLGQVWKLVIVVAALAAVGWLWFSWRGGMFLNTPDPSSGEQGVYTPSLTEEEVIDSLSVPNNTESTDSPSSSDVRIESLTPAAPVSEVEASNKGKPAVDSSILDSLSAPPQ